MYNNTNTNTLQMKTKKVVQELCYRHFHRALFYGAAKQFLFTTEGRVANTPTAHGKMAAHGLALARHFDPRYRRYEETFFA